MEAAEVEVASEAHVVSCEVDAEVDAHSLKSPSPLVSEAHGAGLVAIGPHLDRAFGFPIQSSSSDSKSESESAKVVVFSHSAAVGSK